MRTADDVVAYIGLDWGDQRHAIAVQPAAGGRVEHSELEQRPDTLHAWVAQLRRRFGGRPVGIAIEQRRGAVMHALMMYEFLVLYPVNPKALRALPGGPPPRAGPKTTRPMPRSCWICCVPIAPSSARGCPTPWRPAGCNCSANTAGSSSITGSP